MEPLGFMVCMRRESLRDFARLLEDYRNQTPPDVTGSATA
jgi:hypothetical protein